MKIFSINPALNYGTKSPSFKGLWGDTKQEELEYQHYDGGQDIYVGCDHTRITKDYYPFSDETDEQIAKVIKDFKSTEKRSSEYDGLASSYEEHAVNVVKRIPVTEQTYQNYIERKLLSRAEMRVEDKLKLAGLQRFLR